MRNPAGLLSARMRRREQDRTPAAEPAGYDGQLLAGDAGDGQSVLDDIAGIPERDIRAAPRHAATAALQGPRSPGAPAGSQPDRRPSFRPRRPRPTAETTAIPLPVAGRPYYAGDPHHRGAPAGTGVPPVIGDSLPALPAVPEPPAPQEPGTSPALYAGPGWAGRLMSMRVADGEWDDVQALAEHALGRNAAEEAAGYRHSRTTIGEGVARQCTVIGQPGLAGPLLRHVHELNVAARAAAAAALAPAEAVREAHAVLHAAMEAPGCEAVKAAMTVLGDALDVYAELDGDGLHWENVYPHLRGEADPDGEALRKAAEEAGAAAKDLIEVMAAYRGTEDEMTSITGAGE